MGNSVMKMKMLMMVVLVGGMEVKEVSAQECPHREYAWTHTVGGEGFEDAQAGVAVDADDNIYIGGEFSDRVDFNPFVTLHPRAMNYSGRGGSWPVVK